MLIIDEAFVVVFNFAFPDPSRIFVSPQNVTENENMSVVFECHLEGKPFSKVTWWYGQKQINTSHTRFVAIAPTVFTRSLARLTIMNLTRSDEGFYRCKVENELHTEYSMSAYLTVQSKFAQCTYTYLGFL